MTALKVLLYLLSALTCLACTVLLIRQFLRTRARLLLWSALCFVGLTLSNALLVVDLVLLPERDLRPARMLAALLGLSFLLYGFIWESDR